jgi:MerR family transcriptional regulator, light-induced transcriptional regulator
MEVYQINDLERLTGIKAHTIRIWEKRYSIIQPSRTDTNRRYYSGMQMRKLLNVTTLLSFGHKISKIAALSEEEICRQIELDSMDSGTSHANAGYINDLIACMMAYDEPGFEKVFSAAVLRMGLYDTMLHVVYPFLHKTGVLWSINKTVPVQEHFASCIIRRKLMAAIDGVLPPQKKSKSFMLFLPPGEWHEIGLLFADYIIRSNGYQTIYLGQNVPFENVAEIVDTLSVSYLLTFFVASRPANEIANLIKDYALLGGNAKLIVAGSPDLLPPEKSLPANASYMIDVAKFVELLQESSK